MALMRPLQLTPEVSLPTAGWKLLATEAGRYATGLRATIQLWNSEPQGVAQLALAYPGQWADFITEVAAKAGCPVDAVTTALRTLTTAVEGVLRESEQQTEHISQATALVELAATAELFHSPEEEAFATIEVDDHRETWPLKTKGFRLWLAHQFYTAHQKKPKRTSRSGCVVGTRRESAV